ncbi:MAG: DNA alkylation repair protein [Lentimicrobiaceae bacterium]|nr:DNA alkylation repair protein [Lentimicrobiaceae bacterium]
MTAELAIDSLQTLADEEKARFLQRFFKTGKGQYAEGDVFWGIKVPETRQVAKAYRTMPLAEVGKMLKNPVHEVRLCGLMILTAQFNKANETERKTIVDFYLSNTQYINNWDLVDLSCYKILGTYLLDKPRTLLYRLAKSKTMWEQRIAIVSTWQFIRNGEFGDTLAISELLLSHSHDLMHKAVGWMLREVAKKDEKLVLDFIQKHYQQMPRTMLRYAIEKVEEDKRKSILRGEME